MKKIVENRLYVYIELEKQLNLVGVINFHEDNYLDNKISATFEYNDDYLNNSLSFALDPINLPLSKKKFYTESKLNKLGVLFDAAPDSWGRKIIEIENNKNVSEYDILVKGRGNNVGAISFSTQLLTAPQTQRNFHINEIEKFDDISSIINYINNVIDKKQYDERFLESSWDIGGARPKVVVQVQEQQYIVKFQQDKDMYDKQKVEHSCLLMANDIGLNVSKSSVVSIENSDDALFIKRFDRVGSGKIHYISAVSLVSPPSDFEKRDLDSNRGKVIFSYAKVADIIRKISSNPIRDLLELYTRMVFNVAIHNTDDHLKNTGFIKDEKGYRLAPLFDVSPQYPQYHMIHIGQLGRIGNYENLISDYKYFGIKNISIAEAIIEKVKSVVEKRQDYYDIVGLSKKDREHIEEKINFPSLEKPNHVVTNNRKRRV